MIVARYWKKTKGEFETDFYKSKEQGRAGKFVLNSLQAINVLRHLQNVTTVGVENNFIILSSCNGHVILQQREFVSPPLQPSGYPREN